MALTPREKLLMALNHDDIQWYCTVLEDFKDSLNKFVDSRGKNFFHDLCRCLLLQERVKEYFDAIIKVFHSNVKFNLLEWINAKALIDEDGLSPLHYAIIMHKRVKIMQELALWIIKYGGEIASVTNAGETCLHLAAKSNFISFVVILVEQFKIPINLLNASKQTCLHLALAHNNFDLSYIIIALSDNIDIQDPSGKTALHFAVEKDKKKVVKHLKLRGANENIKDNEGVSPLDLAIDNKAIKNIIVQNN